MFQSSPKLNIIHKLYWQFVEDNIFWISYIQEFLIYY